MTFIRNMSIQNTNRRLTPATIHQDITTYNGLQTIEGYSTTRPDATPEALKSAYENMLVKQREAVEKEVLFKAAADAARLAEWEFHNRILSIKEAVKGQFGSDSDAAAAVGFKKKSERKRPSKKKN